MLDISYEKHLLFLSSIIELAKCRFTAEYWDSERQVTASYICPDDEQDLGLGLCIFHDENYLQDKDNSKEHEHEIVAKLMAKVDNSVIRNEALFCIGYHLPDITNSNW